MLLQLATLKLLRNKLRAKVVKRATTLFNLQCDKLSENVARIGGFHAISGDTNNNGEMNKCWWTNKAS